MIALTAVGSAVFQKWENKVGVGTFVVCGGAPTPGGNSIGGRPAMAGTTKTGLQKKGGHGGLPPPPSEPSARSLPHRPAARAPRQEASCRSLRSLERAFEKVPVGTRPKAGGRSLRAIEAREVRLRLLLLSSVSPESGGGVIQEVRVTGLGESQ